MASPPRAAVYAAARAGREVTTLTKEPALKATPAPAKDFLPGPVLLLGAPGVGKGTQAKALMAAYGIPQISTGDILRANISTAPSLGKQAKALVDRGTLVSDYLVNQMVADRLSQPDTPRGFILDGFPPPSTRPTWLDTKLAADPTVLPVVAISIVVDYEQLLHRITGRRISRLQAASTTSIRIRR